ncbi:hypothetical protein diail_9761 [Diaporthe ilicicola]|nr:hypothetical protein diail_9761 [Diaporthe ilicicola]
MSDPSESAATPKKGSAQLNEKQTKLLVAMAQNTIGKVEYNWEKIAVDSGYKNVASAKTTWSRLLSNMSNGTGKSPTDKGDAPVAGGPKTPSKVTKRTGKVGSSSTKKSHGKKSAAAAAAAAEADAGEDDDENGEQVEATNEKQCQVKNEVDGKADAMMSGAL